MLDTSTKPKAFAWSYSKLKNFETCPRRYQAVDLDKSHGQGGPPSEELQRGDDLHDAMRDRVIGSTPLPPQFIYMNHWAEKLTRVLHPYQIIQCELKLSTDDKGNPTGYFDKTTWVRTKIDYLRTLPTGKEGVDVGHIVDYKTGKPPKVWDGTQLLINAYTVFASYKHIQTLRVDYLWTEYNDTTHETYRRDEVPKQMEAILPRVAALEIAHKTNTFEPKPCGLCKDYCPVSSCEYWGKGLRR
jgi:hypothetical protein